MVKHNTTGFVGELVQEANGKVATLAKKGVATILTSNGIKFSAPASQFSPVTKK